MSASLAFWIMTPLLIAGLSYAVLVTLNDVLVFIDRHITVCRKPRPLAGENRIDALGANPYRGRYS